MTNQTEMGYWPQSGLFPIKVVGTRFYRESIARVAQNPKGESALVFCNASLVLESNNPYDEQAVLVAVGSEKVGHLSRDLASALRERLCSFGLNGEQTQCRAVISAGLEAQGKIYDYVVELDLDLALQPTTAESPNESVDRRDATYYRGVTERISRSPRLQFLLGESRRGKISSPGVVGPRRSGQHAQAQEYSRVDNGKLGYHQLLRAKQPRHRSWAQAIFSSKSRSSSTIW